MQFTRKQADALIAEALAIRCQLSAERVLISLYRLFELTTRAGYNPAQLRLPRGMAGGGRWTDDGGTAGGPSGSKPNGKPVRFAQARTGRGPRPPVQTSRGPLQATPRQEVEVIIATMQADRALALVRRVDPNWSPRPSLHSTIEGEITYQRSIPNEANAYLNSLLRSLGTSAPASRRIGDNGGPPMTGEPASARQSPYSILVPDGRIIGYRSKGAGSDVRTLLPDTFDATVFRLTEGRFGVEPPNDYRGLYYYYDLPDRCVIGFRMSDINGLTFEIIDSSNLNLQRKIKFHRGE